MHAEIEVIERRAGRSGELILRHGPSGYEIVSDGSFLISDANEVSSRAMIGAAEPHLAKRDLRVFVGGLGLGYALDEALSCERVESVIVAEIESAIVDWYHRFCGERASRAARDSRARVVVADAFDLLMKSPRAFDLVALDTDNGPEWLVRGENGRLYDDDGLRTVAGALRPGAAAVFWSPDTYPDFERRLKTVFAGVKPVVAHDVVDGRRFAYTMYVCPA